MQILQHFRGLLYIARSAKRKRSDTNKATGINLAEETVNLPTLTEPVLPSSVQPNSDDCKRQSQRSSVFYILMPVRRERDFSHLVV